MVIQLECKYSGKHRVYSEEELEVVRIHFDGSSNSVKAIKNALWTHFNITRTEYSIRKIASELGLTRKFIKPARWSDKEEELLTEMVGNHTHSQIARKMGRTTNSINQKCKDLGLSTMLMRDWFTIKESAEILGMSVYALQKAIKYGKLNYKKREESNAENIDWHLEEQSLREFIVKYPSELTGRNCDMVQIVNILLPNGLPNGKKIKES